MDIIQIPLASIDAAALPRDRASLTPDALAELQASIVAEGLRQPIEVWRLSTPQDGFDYGLISGLRRLTALRNLAALRPAAYPTVPAFLRTPTDIPAALMAMVAENEIRADPTHGTKAASCPKSCSSSISKRSMPPLPLCTPTPAAKSAPACAPAPRLLTR